MSLRETADFNCFYVQSIESGKPGGNLLKGSLLTLQKMLMILEIIQLYTL